MSNGLKIRNSFFLVLTAFIWGSSFVAQSRGGEEAGPFTYNSIRCIIGGIVLIPVIAISGRNNKRSDADKRNTVIGGVCCGVALFFASSFQQMGINLGTPTGKAGFLTACYILLVPVLGLIMGKRCGANIWAGMGIAVIGLYLLCMDGGIGFRMSDTLVLICALLFAVHIYVIDYFSPKADGVLMSCIQFFVCGILSAVPMFFVDMNHSPSGIAEWLTHICGISAWLPILYGGVLSCGVGYTLQIIGQNGLNPTVASMLMSLESVFAVLSGWVVLGERLDKRQLAGCILIFMAIILAELPFKGKKIIKGE